jgi:hypothetical protein
VGGGCRLSTKQGRTSSWLSGVHVQGTMSFALHLLALPDRVVENSHGKPIDKRGKTKTSENTGLKKAGDTSNRFLRQYKDANI